jgi:hypothetical protein
MGDRAVTVPPEWALSSTQGPADPTYREVHTVYHYHGTVINVDHAANVNSGDNYGKPLHL